MSGTFLVKVIETSFSVSRGYDLGLGISDFTSHLGSEVMLSRLYARSGTIPGERRKGCRSLSPSVSSLLESHSRVLRPEDFNRHQASHSLEWVEFVER